MDSKRSKIKARPTPGQVKILRALVENPGLAVVWNGRGARWIGGNWPAIKRELGDPRQVSVRALVRDGLLENHEGSEIHWKASAAGAAAFDQYGPIPLTEPRATSHDLFRALEHRYGRTHALVSELPVDLERKRRVDVFAVPLHRSTDPIAFELKVTRSDFISELEQPLKRQAAMQIAKYFYFVTPRRLIELPDELPSECGLLEWNGRQLELKVEAAVLGYGSRPSWALVASIAKRLTASRS